MFIISLTDVTFARKDLTALNCTSSSSCNRTPNINKDKEERYKNRVV
jgi:hypothetical protein